MTDLTGAVQLALYNALSAADGLPPVVSEVPVNDSDQPVYPFVLLGDDNVTPQGSKTHRLEQHEVSIHVCMQSVDKLTVRAAQELVRAAVQDQPLTSVGVSLSKPVATTQNTPLLDDGATYIGTQLFTLFAQEA